MRGAALDGALDYVRSQPAVWEVILTGGDPLVLSDRRLAGIVKELAAIAHVKVVRLHTRMPVVDPDRITPKLVRALSAGVKATYVVLHAKLSKPFREQFTPDQLKNGFKAMVDQKADWALIAAMPPIATGEAGIDERGWLILRGYFDTKPSRLNYELAFVPSEGQWKPIKLSVDLKAPKAN